MTAPGHEALVNALIVGSIAATIAAVVGYFLVLRNLTFAGHALAHVGFAGAAGAELVGVNPLAGLLLLTVGGGAAMGWLGENLTDRDVAVGVILMFSLGLGTLFLGPHSDHDGHALSLLFGNIFAVDRGSTLLLALMAALSLAALALIARPLIFVSLEPEAAQARGVRPRLLSVLFLMVAAVAVTEAVQVVGILLVFALLVGPAAAALRIARHIASGVALSVIIGLGVTWSGIILTAFTGWPVSFWLTALSAAAYIVSLPLGRCRARAPF